MIYGIIYKITDLENGKCYIGQTIDYTRGKRDYKYSRNVIESYGYDNCNNITKAFFDKGYDNFEFSVIDAGDSPEELCELENYWIDYYDSINPEKGYNETYAVIRRPISEKTKKKMSRIKGEFKHSVKTKLKNQYL